MGQYHFTVNLDKQEYLNPNDFGQGLKLREHCHGLGITTALMLLLAKDNGQGGGDFKAYHNCPEKDDLIASISGRWSGDRIVIAGDYGDDYKEMLSPDIIQFMKDNEIESYNLYDLCSLKFKNISDIAFHAVFLSDKYIGDIILKYFTKDSPSYCYSEPPEWMKPYFNKPKKKTIKFIPHE